MWKKKKETEVSKMKFKVGDRVIVKSFEEILNSGSHYTAYDEYVNFFYTHLVYNKNYMLSFCEKTFFVVSIINSSEPTYQLGTANIKIEQNDDIREIQNFVWHEKWLKPEREFVLDFEGTPDERED